MQHMKDTGVFSCHTTLLFLITDIKQWVSALFPTTGIALVGRLKGYKLSVKSLATQTTL